LEKRGKGAAQKIGRREDPHSGNREEVEQAEKKKRKSKGDLQGGNGHSM